MSGGLLLLFPSSDVCLPLILLCLDVGSFGLDVGLVLVLLMLLLVLLVVIVRVSLVSIWLRVGAGHGNGGHHAPPQAVVVVRVSVMMGVMMGKP